MDQIDHGDHGKVLMDQIDHEDHGKVLMDQIDHGDHVIEREPLTFIGISFHPFPP